MDYARLRSTGTKVAILPRLHDIRSGNREQPVGFGRRAEPSLHPTRARSGDEYLRYRPTASANGWNTSATNNIRKEINHAHWITNSVFQVSRRHGAIRPKLKEIVTTAEEAGFYSLWVMDHYYQIKGLFGEAYTDPMLEAYTTLGYFAGLTEKAYLGVLVTGVIYRHPAVLLKMVNTLDILSGGRAYFGIGAAWYEDEAKGNGIPYPSTAERFEQLEDSLKLAKALWSRDEISFAGKHFSAPAITNNPRPLSSPHPRIMIGGTGPNKTLRMVAQYADACNIGDWVGTENMQKRSIHSSALRDSGT